MVRRNGTSDAFKTDEFSEKFGSFSIKKFMLQILGLSAGLFEDEIERNLQLDFPKMRGGGQPPFGTFPKIQPFW